ncbi:MAG: outer membrane beta-barrel protein [Minwuia sp.]|uniref:outer membrane beta-barrel protein n=1 Tax=Minwuia sp. TaxID=2493630 RepID=UPI003A883DE3
MRKNVLKVSTTGIALAAAAGIAMAAGSANAAEWGSTFLSVNEIRYLDNFANDQQNAAIRESDVRASTRNDFYATGRYEGNVLVRVGGRLQYFQFFERTDQDNLLIGAYGSVAKRFDNGIFARVRYAADYRRKDGVDQYIENGISPSINYLGSRSYRVGLNTNFAYRDFDNQNFPGLDQTRASVSGFAFWYPFQDTTFLYASSGYQRVNADNSAQSTDLWWIGARFGYSFTPEFKALLRARYSDKDFDSGRADEIMELFGRVDYEFTKSVTGFAEAGVVDQQSNIATQDFTGPQVAVGVRLLFNSGK